MVHLYHNTSFINLEASHIHSSEVKMIRLKALIPAIGLFALTAACNASYNGQAGPEIYPNATLLADALWLQDYLHREDFRIVDMRPEGFEEGHIPGSVNIQGAGALVDGDHSVANFLIPAGRFETMMSKYGIGNDHTVIIYDDGNSLHASRLFYALELYGHENVKILNGGFAAWKDVNGEITTEMLPVEQAAFHAGAGEGLICDLAYVRENIGNENVVFYDARSREEFEGTVVRAERGGHIPGAVHLEWSESIRDEGVPYFKSATELHTMLAEKGITPDKEIIPHCQSNVRGSHVYFMLRLMGYDSVRPYEGSWSEYGNTEGVSVEN